MPGEPAHRHDGESSASSQTLTYNAGNYITSTGHSHGAARNMTARPGATYTSTYAGAAQNAVLTQSGNGHTRTAVCGRPDRVGHPTIAQYNFDRATAYVEQDPVIG